MAGEQAGQVRVARLLFAVEPDADVHGQQAGRREITLQGSEHGDQRPLVVAGPAAVYPALGEQAGERRPVPRGQGPGRLDVDVGVQQEHGRPAGRATRRRRWPARTARRGRSRSGGARRATAGRTEGVPRRPSPAGAGPRRSPWAARPDGATGGPTGPGRRDAARGAAPHQARRRAPAEGPAPGRPAASSACGGRAHGTAVSRRPGGAGMRPLPRANTGSRRAPGGGAPWT